MFDNLLDAFAAIACRCGYGRACTLSDLVFAIEIGRDGHDTHRVLFVDLVLSLGTHAHHKAEQTSAELALQDGSIACSDYGIGSVLQCILTPHVPVARRLRSPIDRQTAGKVKCYAEHHLAAHSLFDDSARLFLETEAMVHTVTMKKYFVLTEACKRL